MSKEWQEAQNGCILLSSGRGVVHTTKTKRVGYIVRQRVGYVVRQRVEYIVRQRPRHIGKSLPSAYDEVNIHMYLRSDFVKFGYRSTPQAMPREWRIATRRN